MASRRRPHSLKAGDRARDKTNRRVGRIDEATRVQGRRHYVVSYDEAPQDHFLTTPAKDGAELPQELVEPE
jgi:hypothetical protein